MNIQKVASSHSIWISCCRPHSPWAHVKVFLTNFMMSSLSLYLPEWTPSTWPLTAVATLDPQRVDSRFPQDDTGKWQFTAALIVIVQLRPQLDCLVRERLEGEESQSTDIDEQSESADAWETRAENENCATRTTKAAKKSKNVQITASLSELRPMWSVVCVQCYNLRQEKMCIKPMHMESWKLWLFA